MLVHNCGGRCANDKSMPDGDAGGQGLTPRDKNWPWRGLHEIEDHHPLMRGQKYREYWRSRGFTDAEIDKWTEGLDKDIHRTITESGWWEQRLFEQIAKEKAKLGCELSKAQILQIIDELLNSPPKP